MKTQITSLISWNQTHFLFLCKAIFLSLVIMACGSKDDLDDMDNTDNSNNSVSINTTFAINVTGALSRPDMIGTNATYKFNKMPDGFVTTHQLAIYLTDSEGYTVTGTILVNGTEVPPKGTYRVLDWTSGASMQAGDAGLMFGQNGAISHSTAGSAFGQIKIKKIGNNYIEGDLIGTLAATANGSGAITMNGNFKALYKP